MRVGMIEVGVDVAKVPIAVDGGIVVLKIGCGR